ncbi:lipase family protein [Flaviaesturariibacter flavus]|uniref:Lipase family protein n=1 Tax=Flaviaesturariibacter flavus TaxID=2502780 RepID=A0A4R1B3J8_9BACT|nr:lipase family protein [Flaviaesturariibacter flavus]TCJ12634.1 lipase family protein [Flaviaesturariibacter flavus]
MKNTFLFLFFFFPLWVCAQTGLKAGFDAAEFGDVLALNFGRYDSIVKAEGRPGGYRRIYTSPVTGLDNRWTAWQHADTRTVVIGVRGTVGSTKSWLANIYSVMQPAAGVLQLNDSTRVPYRLAAREGAAVHTGWLIALCSMTADVERKIRELYDKGARQFIISGHSQGGAIAYLLRAYLYYRTQEGALPADITYKTYCSAAPKPGNLDFAYDYDYITRGGWSHTVVNAADWVPETPLSLQQISDLNPVNPLVNLKGALRRQKLPVRVYGSMVYNKLTHSGRKAVAKYQKYLGERVGKEVRKVFPQLQLPGTQPGLDYMRAGSPVVLMPDSAYTARFPFDAAHPHGVWIHHSFEAYYYLLRKDWGHPG